MLQFAVLLVFLYSLRLSGAAGSFPKPLSQAEEREYLHRAAQGDLEARNVLIERNLRLVAHIMKKYYAIASDQDDLISIGTIGLIKGISSYDESKGTRLATYAARCVENEILMYFRAQKKRSADVSLSDLIEAGAESGALSLMETVCSEEDLFEDISNRQLQAQLRGLMERCLTEQEQTILRLRYGIDQPKALPQREVASQCGISRSYVSRIEKRALGKLRRELEKDA